MLKRFAAAGFIGVVLLLMGFSGRTQTPSAAIAAGTAQVIQVSATAQKDASDPARLNTDQLNVTLTLPSPQSGGVSVHVAVRSPDTALTFAPPSGTVTIPAGSTSGTFTALVYVPPLIGDSTAAIHTKVTAPAGSTLTTNPAKLTVTVPSPFGAAPAPGYWLATAKGDVYTFSAPFYGSLSITPSSPIVGMADTPTGGGYWLVDAAGSVYAFGDAHPHGSLSSKPTAPIVAIAGDAETGGYWLFGRDGSVYAFDAHDYGRPSALSISVVGAAAAPDSLGYWLVTSTGLVQGFGPGARFHGDASSDNLTAPVVGMVADPHTGGYWLVTAKGAVYAFGAPDLGQVLGQPATGIAADPSSKGYWVSLSDGGVSAFGAKFYGSAAPDHPSSPIIAIVGR